MLLAGNSGWFIYCLFFILLINRAFYKFRILIAVVLFAIASMGLVKTTLFTLDRIVYYDLFFVFGTIIKMHYDKIQNYMDNHGELIILISVSVYGILIYSFPQVFFIDETVLPIVAISFVWTTIYLMMKSSDFKVLKFFGKYSLQFYLNQICLLPIYYLGLLSFKYLHSYQITFFVIFLTAVITIYIMLQLEKRTGKAKVLFGL